MDILYYQFNDLILGENDLTDDELNNINGVEIGSLIGLRKDLFKVESLSPLKLKLVKNVAF
jgi:hypothetical protein